MSRKLSVTCKDKCNFSYFYDARAIERSDIGFAIQPMVLKQFQFNDSFTGCLKATAMDKYEEASIAVCFS